LFVFALLAREALVGFLAETYLARLGIPSSIAVTRLDTAGLSARLHLGGGDSTITAERLDLGFGKLGLRPEIASVRVVRPSLRLEYNRAGLSLGLLQRLIDILPEEGPDHPSRPVPIVVEDATITLETPAGNLVLNGNVELLGSELKALNASAGAAALTLGATAAHIREIHLRVSGAESGLKLSAQVYGDASLQTSSGEVSVEGLETTLEALIRLQRTNDGLRLEADDTKIVAGAETLRIFTDSLPSVRLDISIAKGALSGIPGAPSLSGQAALLLSTNGGEVSGFAVRRVTAELRGSAQLSTQREFDLTISTTMESGLAPTRLQPLLERLGLLAPSDRRALREILKAIVVNIPSLQISGNRGRISATLDQAMTISGAGKTRAVVSVPPDGTLVDLRNGVAHGALHFHLAGTLLPTVDLALASYTFARQPELALAADLGLSARGDVGGVRGAVLKTRGRLRIQGGDMSYAPTECALLAAANVNATVRDAAASVCPRDDGQFLRHSDGKWHFSAGWSQTRAILSEAEVRIGDFGGALDIVVENDGRLSGNIAISDMLLSDAGTAPRFTSVRTSGSARLRGDRWDGKLSVSSAARKDDFGSVEVTYAPASSSGEARFDFQNVIFTSGGLQPSDLTPQLAAFDSASGGLGLSGRIAWGGGKMASEGVLTFRDLGFNSPAGMINGLRGTVRLSSLLPLASLPDQKVEISEIDSMIPITGASVEFSLEPSKIQINVASGQMADGMVLIDPFTIDLGPDLAFGSTVRLQNIDLGPVVNRTSFADRVQLAVKVKGTIPFSYSPPGVRFLNGSLMSTGPGLLSISRLLWTGPGTAPVNAVQDFAYQAMEHLAVDDLTGEINSLDENRLGMILRIKGRHDPVKPGRTRLKLYSLLKGDAFNEPVPLPAQTPVDLTLDVSLNFGELMRAYGEAFAQVRKRAQ